MFRRAKACNRRHRLCRATRRIPATASDSDADGQVYVGPVARRRSQDARLFAGRRSIGSAIRRARGRALRAVERRIGQRASLPATRHRRRTPRCPHRRPPPPRAFRTAHQSDPRQPSFEYVRRSESRRATETGPTQGAHPAPACRLVRNYRRLARDVVWENGASSAACRHTEAGSDST